MTADPPSNLFDLSRGSGSGPFRKKKPAQKPLQKPLKSSASPSVLDDEVKGALEKIRSMQQKLKEDLAKLYEKGGTTPKELEKFCKDPSNFSKDAFEKFQREQLELKASLLGKSIEKVRSEETKKNSEKDTKARKGKTLGARRNWLDMR